MLIYYYINNNFFKTKNIINIFDQFITKNFYNFINNNKY